MSEKRIPKTVNKHTETMSLETHLMFPIELKVRSVNVFMLDMETTLL